MEKIGEKIYRALRWSERYSKTDMVYLAKGGAWITSGQAVASAASLLLAIAFANFLPKETYGLYKYVLSVVGVLSIATLTGLNISIMRSVSRGHEGSMRRALYTRIRWGLLGSLASLAVASYYFFVGGNTILAMSFVITAFFIPVMEPFSIYLSLLQGKKLFKHSSLYSLIIHVIGTGAMIVVILLNANFFEIILTYFLSYTILRFVALRITLRIFPPNNIEDHEAIPFGKHLSLIGVIDVIASQIDKILLWHFLGAQALATYAFSILPVDQITAGLKSIKSLAFPKLASKEVGVIKRTLPEKMLKLGGALIVPVILYIFLAPFLFKIFFPQYLDAVFFSQIYALSLVLFPKKLMGATLTAHSKKGSLYVLSTGASVVKIALFLLLIPQFGIMGAILAEIGMQIFSTALIYYLFRKM